MKNQNIEALLSIFNGNSRIAKRLDQTLGALHGLGLTEFLTLHHLCEAPAAQSRIALAELLGLSASGVTRLLSPMEKLGLVEKQTNARDARHSLVKITTVGVDKYNDANVSTEQVLNQVFGGINESEKSTLISIIDKTR